MNVFQYDVDYPWRLTMKMKELNPVFVKDFISNPTTCTVLVVTTCTVLVVTLHFKEY